MKQGWFSQIVTQHPDPNLQGLWKLIQLSWLLAPVHGVGFGILMIWAITQCVWQWSAQLNQSWLNRAFCILAIWIVGTVIVAADPYAALLGIFNVLPFFLLFITVSFVVQTIDQLRHLARLSLFPASIVVILGIGQYFLQWQGPPQPWEGILGWGLALGGNPPGRMASVFMYANSMAGYLVMVLPLAIALWLEPMLIDRWQCSTLNHQASAEQTEPPSSDLQDLTLSIPHSLPILQRLSLAASPLLAFTRYALTLLVITILICIVFTHSRNAWGIAALTCLAYALYWGWYWILAILIAGIGVVWGAAFAPMPVSGLLRQVVPRFIWARLTDELYPNRPIAELRITQWKFAQWMTWQRPFTGWGLRNFTPLYLDHTHSYLGHPHNIFLMFTAEIGIPATLLLCGLVGWILAKAMILLRSELLPITRVKAGDRLILLAYVLAFGSCILFNCFDVTALDVRVNAIGWLLLSAIAGVVTQVPWARIKMH